MLFRRLSVAAGFLFLDPLPQESTGFLGVDWWVWILIGVLLLLFLLIIGFVLQNEPGPPIPERESKMYVTASSAAKAKPEAKQEPSSEPESESELEQAPESEPELEPEPESETEDLTRIEGVGPKVAGLLDNAGINTFAALAEANIERLNEILERAELQFMDPSSWPEQAALAAKGDWEAFEKLTAELKGGRR